MYGFERVLAPIDLRGDFEQRAQYAVDIAAVLDAELTLLHVVNAHRLGRRNPGLSWPECAMTRTNPPCVVHRAVVHGEVPDSVARYAEFVDANVIVLSAGRRALWKKLWRRSMIEAIAEATDKPILAGNPGRGGALRLKPHPRILCMLGLAGDDRALVEYAQSLAEQYDGDLVLYTAVPSASGGFPVDMIASQDPPLTADAAMDRLHRMGATLRVPNRSVVVARSPYRGLRATIRRHGVDLVVARRNDRRGVPGAAFDFGPTLSNVSCPLLSIASHTLPMSPGIRQQVKPEVSELTAQGC